MVVSRRNRLDVDLVEVTIFLKITLNLLLLNLLLSFTDSDEFLLRLFGVVSLLLDHDIDVDRPLDIFKSDIALEVTCFSTLYKGVFVHLDLSNLVLKLLIRELLSFQSRG